MWRIGEGLDLMGEQKGKEAISGLGAPGERPAL